MNTIEQILGHKERELEDYLARVDDPTLRQLLSDIATLRRAKELLANAPQGTPSQATRQNGHHATVNIMSQGDATVELLNKAGHPLGVDDVLKEMPKFGLDVKKDNLISALRKDRKKRFSIINNVVSLRGAKGANSHSAANGGPALARMGFSLTGSIKELLPQLHGEFSQPIVYKLLRERHPEVAGLIQKASVATTLRKLQDLGLIEMTYKGYGSEPRRYKKKATA
jgi:hypothetical protein